MRIDDDGAVLFIQRFLSSLRERVRADRLPLNRLPVWIESAKVRHGLVRDCLVFAIEDRPSGADEYSGRGGVGADTVILLDTADFVYRGGGLGLPQGHGPSSIIGVGSDWKPDPRQGMSFVLPPKSALTDAGYAGSGFMSFAFFNLQLQVVNEGESEPICFRVVPFAVMVSQEDFNEKSFCDKLVETTVKYLREAESSCGDYWQDRRYRLFQFAKTKKDGVVVLGTDTGDKLKELLVVRDRLISLGYQAEIIKDLPEVSISSNEEKVRLWCTASRFSVMIDTQPGGHMAEFPELRHSECILAVLRPQGYGSTWMVHDDPSRPNIGFFHFRESPLEVLSQVVDWAEGFAEKKAATYAGYPWR